MHALVIKAESVDRVHCVKLDSPGINEFRQRSHHALPFQLPFVSCTGGESHQRRPPVAINHDAEFESQPRGMPAVIFAFHCEMLSVLRETSMPAHSELGNAFARSRTNVQRESSRLASQ